MEKKILITLQVLCFGTSQSVGVYNIEFLRYFDVGAAAVSLVGSINIGVFLGAGKARIFLLVDLQTLLL